MYGLLIAVTNIVFDCMCKFHKTDMYNHVISCTIMGPVANAYKMKLCNLCAALES